MTPPATLFRIALRELRGGLAGFRVMLACLAIGVAAITAVGTLSRGITDSLSGRAAVLLGGDVGFSILQREIGGQERAALAAAGTVGTVATLRGMARTETDQTLIELKAVDETYPLRGTLALDPPMSPAEATAQLGNVHRAVVERTLLDRLGLKPGDHITIGDARFQIAAAIVNEPDRLASGFGFGPRVLTSIAGLRATGLVQPGSLIRWSYRVVLNNPDAADDLAASLLERFPDSGLEVRTRANIAPQFARNIDRFAQFLTLVGLASLLVGGVGVANAVKAHIASKRSTIATLKALGASGGAIIAIYLVQIGVMALTGIIIGIALGIGLAAGGLAIAAPLLPFEIPVSVHGQVVGVAGLFGLLVATAFALAPLLAARNIPVRALYRDDDSLKPRQFTDVAAVSAVFALLAGVALFLSDDRRFAALVMAGTIAVFFVLVVIGRLIMMIARRLPRPRGAELRLALSAVHRPGALTPTIVLSLGLGLTVLVVLAMIDGNLRRQLTGAIPERAPSFFFIDIPSTEIEPLGRLIEARAPGGRFEAVPQLRGRITAVKGIPSDQAPSQPNARFVLDGDRGITFSAKPPDNATLVTGEWWAEDYAGPPLVSFDHALARGLGLSLGDEITVNVMGRTVRATIANTRQVRWESFGINFVMVFSPGTFRGAPFTALATWTLPGGATPEVERDILSAVTRAHPAVATVRVREALDQANDLVANLAVGVRAVASVAILAAIVVLAGALAAGARARLRDAVILKVLGATRRRLIGAAAIEFAGIGLVTALVALALGTLAAWAIVTMALQAPFVALPTVAVGAVATALVVTVVFGLIGTWRVLSAKPARVLRDL
jgi:putative ABC transport system permease protein